jgi:hypothetical protein
VEGLFMSTGFLRNLVLSSALVGAMASAAWAAPGSPKDSEAKVTVVFEFKGGGEDLPQSKERHVTWSITERFETSATMKAAALSPMGGLHKADAKTTNDMAGRQAAAESAQKNMQPMMEQAQAAMAKCGDDEACMQREAMKMAQALKANPEQQKKNEAAKSAMEKATAPMAQRYQNFLGGKQASTYKIDGKAKEAYFDAACGLKTEERCAYETVLKGEGAAGDDKGNPIPSTAYAEIDYQTGSLMLMLPNPGGVKVTRTVTSANNKQVKTGTTEKVRPAFNGTIFKDAIEVKCGECKTASGTVTKEIDDQFLGRKGTLTAKWTFTRP